MVYSVQDSDEGVLGDVHKLCTISDRTVRVGRARAGRRDWSVEAERNSSSSADLGASDESLLVSTLELALEQTVKLGVLRCRLAIRNGL